MNTLTFDIETIPQLGPLSEVQKEELNKNLESKFKKLDRPPTEEELKKFKGEVMATNPLLGQIVCIGVHEVRGTSVKNVGIIGDEEYILRSFWDLIKDFDGVFISFNGIGFDVPFIIKRSMHYGIKPTNNGFLDTRKYQTVPHFDVRLVFSNYDSYASGKLELICELLGVESSKQGDIKADGVEDAYLSGQINKIKEYCLRDVKATYEVYKILKNYIFTKTHYR